ncbi:MAG: aminopeptidase P family protein [Dysgonamonadaceae bacterium]|jgi:Xaa-Pro aminopeptidase|nr:aminopeptidase P family protein [Dysgonamonadaceae bacterium]
MNHSSQSKLDVLRSAMQASGVQACIIPSTDPHISEYTPERWKTRQWISGFTGSAGTIVVTNNQAGLWTDSRYFLQAEEQLQGSGIALFKAGLPETPSPEEWLKNELKAGDTVGLDGAVFAASDVLRWIDDWKNSNIRIDTCFAPYDTIWKDRPPLPAHPAFVHPETFSGESARSKIDRLLIAMQEQNCQSTLLASLDAIAWMLNLRGNDIEYNPVTISYLFVSEKETVLFISPQKLTPEVTAHLQSAKVVCAQYEKIYTYTQRLEPQRIWITPSKINYALYRSIPENCTLHETAVHPVDAMKAVKNETEIAGIRRAMQRDGVALVKCFHWLDTQLEENKTVTELDISHSLKKKRSEQAYFYSESFETIAAYGPHGAIVHYAATEAGNATLRPEGLLLIDSGAQYLDGTTDITRTLALGPVSDAMKQDFTRLLKGNISLATAQFPRGTVGMQLDVLARQFLWQEAQNYLHGTGHGVGHFLNVHEGPQSIRMNYNPAPLEPGMVTSNEPGIYRTGRYGVRIENLLLAVPGTTSEWGEFYRFETLTLCPIDTRLIDLSLLTEPEREWLNAYHQKVYQLLAPDLSDEERNWLKQKTGIYL